MTIYEEYHQDTRTERKAALSAAGITDSRDVNMTLSIPSPGIFAFYGGLSILVILILAGATLIMEGRVDTSTSDMLTRIFWVDLEQNVPTGLSFALIACASFLVMVTAWRQYSTVSPWRHHWVGLGILLLYIAFDEAARIHEMFNAPLESVTPDTGVFRFAWVLAGIVFVLAVGAIFLRFVFALPPRVRLLVIASGATFLSGALGMEMIAAASIDMADPWLTYRKATLLEEGLEMVGMLIFATAIVTLLCQDAPGTREYLRRGR